ncbi:MAG: substrate-binding domain-containing protein, partial [Pseudomonadota bacterium]
VPASRWPSYDLTTVRQPANRMVKQAVAILLNHIENNDMTPKRVTLPCELKMRTSVKLHVQGA